MGGFCYDEKPYLCPGTGVFAYSPAHCSPSQGFCSVPIGPDPEFDKDLWSSCCPDSQERWDRCLEVPCLFGGVHLCLTSQDCFSRRGHVPVYPCNAHGRLVRGY